MHLAPLLIGPAYGTSALGHFNLATRVLETPINLVANVFSTVYFQHFNRKPAQQRFRTFWKAILALSLAFAPPLLVLSLAGDTIFAFVFGEQWTFSGELARWLAPLALFRILFISQSSFFAIHRRLGLDLAIAVALIVAQVTGFALGFFTHESILDSIFYSSLFLVIVYASALFLIQRILGKSPPPVNS
jgi:O-antigen/teichoic acid export membrane protein